MTDKTNLSDPIYHDEDAARAHFESLRWADGVPVCFHCGVVGEASKVERDESNVKTRKAKGKKVARKGLYYCKACGGVFSATMGTVIEDSHIPMTKWLLASHFMNSSKKGRSAAQLQRDLGLGSYRTAWFLAHRIRTAMPTGDEPLGGPGKIVEADETYFGHRNTDEAPTEPTPRRKHRRHANRAIVALVERGGESRVFHVASANKETVAQIVTQNVHPASRLHTDESALYRGADAHVAAHETTKHSEREFARGDVNSNSAEGFFSTLKTGMVGTYHHCDEKYLPLYVKEFSSRYNHRSKLGFSDKERAALTVKNMAGKRLSLRQPKGNAA